MASDIIYDKTSYAQKVTDFGQELHALIQIKSDDVFRTTTGIAYFGNFLRHSSMAREDKRLDKGPVQTNLPPLANFIGAVHKLYRVDLPKLLDVQLDLEKMPHAKKALDDMDLILKKWRAEVLETGRQEDGKIDPDSQRASRVPIDHLRALDIRASSCVDSLSDSELSELNRYSQYGASTLPVRIGGISATLDNTGNLGKFLMAMNYSTRHLADLHKVHPIIYAFMVDQVKGGGSFIKLIQEHMQNDPALKPHYEEVCRTLYPQMLELVRRNQCALQMVNLLDCDGAHVQYKMKAPSASMLERAHLPLYPSELTPLECAVAMEALPKLIKYSDNDSENNRYNRSYEKLIDECVEIGQNPARKLASHDVDTFLDHLNRHIKSSDLNERDTKVCKLIVACLKSHLQPEGRTASRKWVDSTANSMAANQPVIR